MSEANADRTGERRLKFILFPLGWLLAHVGRQVEIGKVLRARGHEVVFAGDDPSHPRSKLGMAQDAGFRVIYAREPDHPYAWDRFVKRGWLITVWDLWRHQEWAPLDKILEGHVELIRRERPDLVVGDGTISVSTAAHITGVPAAGVMNAYAARFLARTSIFMPMIHIWDALHLSRLRKRVYRKYNRKPVRALRILREIPLISPDLPGLYEEPKGWANWHTVGPLISTPESPMPEWFDELDDGRPNVYITMGSTGLLDAFLRRTYEALGRAAYRFVVTTAGQVSAETIRMAPANFRIAKYAPGGRILEKSRALVFHGGNGTMYQGLAAGAPMIALPSHLEQNICAKIVVRNGFGLRLSPRRVRGDKLVAALERVIREPGFRASAERLGAEVRAGSGAARAADILEAAARGQVLPRA